MLALYKIEEFARLMVIYSIGILFSIFSICIPILKDILKRKDVFTVKDRSSYESRLYTECSDFVQHKTLTLEGKFFHYVEVGDVSKPLILFLHGFPQFWYSWRFQLQGLQDMGYHLVAVDMRGAGGSYKPREAHNYNANLLLTDIRDIIQKLSPNGRAACVVGHDWGSIIAWQAAAQSWEWDQYQDQSGYIDRLIILNGCHMVIFNQNFRSRLTDFIHLYRNLKSLISNPISTLALSWQKFRPCIDQFFGSFYVFIFNLPNPIGESWFLLRDVEIYDKLSRSIPKEMMNEEDINFYKAIFCADNYASLIGGINYYRSNAMNGFFKEQERRGIKQPGFIGIPTLVIWGDKDPTMNKDLCLSNMGKLVSNLKIEHIPEANHFIQEECPDKVNNLIRTFITSQGNYHDLDENIES
ncbi:Alpha/Beta hydrolase protein [Glomus cerebriforme]|uniref:Alpha/Beta hydrolase protein n=1 Tax=Glomus cerebriforme TaxID=658196 RepID=A0A397SQB6_9GLOM|nr:Alpha/Beta hydrolase protein [Glomus cerebriforme]